MESLNSSKPFISPSSFWRLVNTNGRNMCNESYVWGTLDNMRVTETLAKRRTIPPLISFSVRVSEGTEIASAITLGGVATVTGLAPVAVGLWFAANRYSGTGNKDKRSL